MADGNQTAKVVKIKPYPISCQLKKNETANPIKCEILRLEPIGFIFKAINHYFKAGDEFTCEFEIPVLAHKVVEKIRVIKTYETATGGGERPVTVEVHFKEHFHKSEDFIRKFISKIGQKSA